jgi:hypothetical protein
MSKQLAKIPDLSPNIREKIQIPDLSPNIREKIQIPDLSPNIYEKIQIPDLSPNIYEKIQILEPKSPDKNFIIESLNNNTCYHCNKIFSKRGNVERHIKNSCSVVKEQNKKLQTIYDDLYLLKTKNEIIEKDNEEMKKYTEEIKKDNEEMKKNNEEMKKYSEEMKKYNEEMKKKIESLESQLIVNQKGGSCGDIINSNNTINNINNTNNNIINITMIGYGKEDMNRINPELKDIIMTLKKGWQSPKYLINKTHFNPKFPEYHSIYIPDIKNKFAMVHNGQNYLLKNTSDIINDLYDRHVDYIKEKFEKYGDKIPKSKKNALAELIKLVPLDENEQDKEKKEMKERLFESIKLLLFNKRNIPMKTREKILQIEKDNK